MKRSPTPGTRRGAGRAYLAGLAPVAAAVHPRATAVHPRHAAAHPRHAAAILRRRRDVVVGDVALIVDDYLTGLAILGDGGGCADHCGYRKPCANRRQECGEFS